MLALLLGVPTLRLRADYLAIVTIAAAEIIRQTFGSVTLLKYFGGQDGLQGFTGSFRPSTRSAAAIGIPGVVSWRPYDFWTLLVGWVLVALCCLIVWLLMRSPWGRVLKGIREDEDAVRSLGKNVYAYKMQSLIIGGLIGGLGGIMSALQHSAINPSSSPPTPPSSPTRCCSSVAPPGSSARSSAPISSGSCSASWTCSSARPGGRQPFIPDLDHGQQPGQPGPVRRSWASR